MVWSRRAFERRIVWRALKYAVVVGTLLLAINHGDAIFRGDLTPGQLIRMALTVIVPYVVSTLSSLEATAQSRTDEHPGGREGRGSG